MRTQIIRRRHRFESMVPLAEITGRALINSDCCQLMNRVRYLPFAIQERWLENLAKNVIALVKELPRTRERDWVIIERLRAMGYERFEDADISVLTIRLMRAGYLTREEAA